MPCRIARKYCMYLRTSIDCRDSRLSKQAHLAFLVRTLPQDPLLQRVHWGSIQGWRRGFLGKWQTVPENDHEAQSLLTLKLPVCAAPGKHRVLCYGDSLTAGLAGNFVTEYAPYASRLSELSEYYAFLPCYAFAQFCCPCDISQLRVVFFQIFPTYCKSHSYDIHMSCAVGCQVDHIGLSGWTTSQMTK